MPRQASAAAQFATTGTTRQLMQPPSDLNEVERAEFVALVLGAPPSPKRVAEVIETGHALVTEAKGLGRGR